MNQITEVLQNLYKHCDKKRKKERKEKKNKNKNKNKNMHNVNIYGSNYQDVSKLYSL